MRDSLYWLCSFKAQKRLSLPRAHLGGFFAPALQLVTECVHNPFEGYPATVESATPALVQFPSQAGSTPPVSARPLKERTE